MAAPKGKQPKGGKKNRKHGRNKNSPAMQRYNAEKRDEKNKARRVAKDRKAKLAAQQ